MLRRVSRRSLHARDRVLFWVRNRGPLPIDRLDGFLKTHVWEREYIQDKTHRVIVPTAHQTDENATAPCKAKLFLYPVGTVYHNVHVIVYSCAVFGRMRAVAGKGSRGTEIDVSGVLKAGRDRTGTGRDSLPYNYGRTEEKIIDVIGGDCVNHANAVEVG